jgi:hypothetical protein
MMSPHIPAIDLKPRFSGSEIAGLERLKEKKLFDFELDFEYISEYRSIASLRCPLKSIQGGQRGENHQDQNPLKSSKGYSVFFYSPLENGGKMSDLILYQPYFYPGPGVGSPMYFLRIAKEGDQGYVVKLTDRYWKTGRIIADCEIVDYANYYQFICTSNHWGFVDVCRLFRDRNVTGDYLDYLRIYEELGKESAETVSSNSNISFQCAPVDEIITKLWKIHGPKTQKERKEAEELEKLSSDKWIKKTVDRLRKERGLGIDEESARAKVEEIRQRLKSREVTPTIGDE